MNKQKVIAIISIFAFSICMVGLGDKKTEEPTIYKEETQKVSFNSIELGAGVQKVLNEVPVVQVESAEQETESDFVYYDIPLSHEEQKLIYLICQKYNVDMKLVLGIAEVESCYNPSNIGDNGDSLGIMQIQPKWWKHYFDMNECNNWLSINDNVTVGCEILVQLFEEHEDIRLVLNAYNTGNPDNHNGYADKVFKAMENLDRKVIQTDECRWN